MSVVDREFEPKSRDGASTSTRSVEPPPLTAEERAREVVAECNRACTSAHAAVEALRESHESNDPKAWHESKERLEHDLISVERGISRARSQNAPATEIAVLETKLADLRGMATKVQEPPRGWRPVAREESILAVLRAPIEGDKRSGFARKEELLRSELAQLNVADSRLLADRLRKSAPDDSIASEISRMVPERRLRVLSFLEGARRREATSAGNTPSENKIPISGEQATLADTSSHADNSGGEKTAAIENGTSVERNRPDGTTKAPEASRNGEPQKRASGSKDEGHHTADREGASNTVRNAGANGSPNAAPGVQGNNVDDNRQSVAGVTNAPNNAKSTADDNAKAPAPSADRGASRASATPTSHPERRSDSNSVAPEQTPSQGTVPVSAPPTPASHASSAAAPPEDTKQHPEIATRSPVAQPPSLATNIPSTSHNGHSAQVAAAYDAAERDIVTKSTQEEELIRATGLAKAAQLSADIDQRINVAKSTFATTRATLTATSRSQAALARSESRTAADHIRQDFDKQRTEAMAKATLEGDRMIATARQAAARITGSYLQTRAIVVGTVQAGYAIIDSKLTGGDRDTARKALHDTSIAICEHVQDRANDDADHLVAQATNNKSEALSQARALFQSREDESTQLHDAILARGEHLASHFEAQLQLQLNALQLAEGQFVGRLAALKHSSAELIAASNQAANRVTGEASARIARLRMQKGRALASMADGSPGRTRAAEIIGSIDREHAGGAAARFVSAVDEKRSNLAARLDQAQSQASQTLAESATETSATCMSERIVAQQEYQAGLAASTGPGWSKVNESVAHWKEQASRFDVSCAQFASVAISQHQRLNNDLAPKLETAVIRSLADKHASWVDSAFHALVDLAVGLVIGAVAVALLVAFLPISMAAAVILVGAAFLSYGFYNRMKALSSQWSDWTPGQKVAGTFMTLLATVPDTFGATTFVEGLFATEAVTGRELSQEESQQKIAGSVMGAFAMGVGMRGGLAVEAGAVEAGAVESKAAASGAGRSFESTATAREALPPETGPTPTTERPAGEAPTTRDTAPQVETGELDAKATAAADRLRASRAAVTEADAELAAALKDLQGSLGRLHSTPYLDPTIYAKVIKVAYVGAKKGIRSFDLFIQKLKAQNLLDDTDLKRLSDQARRQLEVAFYDGLAKEAGEVVPRVEYRISESPSPPQPGARQTAIDRAWRLEADLVKRTGRGSRGWSDAEIQAISEDKTYRDLGYTGHHINRVHDFPAWQGDPRNIEFLRQGSGNEHMADGHPGGTRAAQPEKPLIDRAEMLSRYKPEK